MSLIPWKPFRDLDNFFEDWEWPESLSAAPAIRAPKIDVYKDKGNVIVEAELPGVEPKDIELEVKDNTLKIEAKTEEEKEKKEKGYYRKEISRGYYKRMVALPAEVQGEKAKADYSKGVLKIVIPEVKPKNKEKKGIKVKIKSKKE